MLDIFCSCLSECSDQLCWRPDYLNLDGTISNSDASDIYMHDLTTIRNVRSSYGGCCRLCLKGTNTDRAQWCGRKSMQKTPQNKVEERRNGYTRVGKLSKWTTAFGNLWKLCVAMALGDIICKEWVNNCWWSWQNRTTLEKCTHLYNETQETIKHKCFRHPTKTVESTCV